MNQRNTATLLAILAIATQFGCTARRVPLLIVSPSGSGNQGLQVEEVLVRGAGSKSPPTPTCASPDRLREGIYRAVTNEGVLVCLVPVLVAPPPPLPLDLEASLAFSAEADGRHHLIVLLVGDKGTTGEDSKPDASVISICGDDIRNLSRQGEKTVGGWRSLHFEVSQCPEAGWVLVEPRDSAGRVGKVILQALPRADQKPTPPPTSVPTITPPAPTPALGETDVLTAVAAPVVHVAHTTLVGSETTSSAARRTGKLQIRDVEVELGKQDEKKGTLQLTFEAEDASGAPFVALEELGGVKPSPFSGTGRSVQVTGGESCPKQIKKMQLPESVRSLGTAPRTFLATFEVDKGSAYLIVLAASENSQLWKCYRLELEDPTATPTPTVTPAARRSAKSWSRAGVP